MFVKASNNVTIDKKKNTTTYSHGQSTSAPFRPATVYDALSDLPSIAMGAKASPLRYTELPKTHYQRTLRIKGLDEVCDHVTKDFTGLILARVKLIPKARGSDWRDLPNIEVDIW